MTAPNSPIQAFRAPSDLFSPGQPPNGATPAGQTPAGPPGAVAGRPGGATPGGGASTLPFGVLPGGGGFRGGLLACRNPDAYNLSVAERQRCLERLGAGANRVAPADPIAAARARLNAEAAAAAAARAYRNSTGPGVGPSTSDVPNRGGFSSAPDGGPPTPNGNPSGALPPTRGRDLPAQYTPPARVGPGEGN